jgi:hypothetical protein
MAARPIPDDYVTIDELLDAGDLDGARAVLAGVPASDEAYAVLRHKLAMYDGSLPPAAVMQRLIQLMRRDADWHGAKELYQEASNTAYQSRQSNAAHSHPPPPVDVPGGDESKS